ncbi:MAG TPA: formimidoylglutamate deiminase [Actinomycetota bacterium]|nr:formimidoylglutamate deiminase [Actinomycetota bacterium]
MVTWHAERAWIGAMADDVLIETDGDRITAVTAGVPAPDDAVRLSGLALPGLVNAHSHAFHRALRGRTHEPGDFWRWRELMYQVASALDPDRYRALATATFAEMALAGITTVGEFHYLHHRSEGRAYEDPNAMGLALVDAARAAGIRLTLLDTCYLRGGMRNADLDAAQLRFADADVDAWAGRVDALSGNDTTKIGAAIHSVRAVDPGSMARVAEVAHGSQQPLHIHVSEQAKENEECVAVFGMSPTELVADRGVLGPRTTIVHGTHVSALDIELLATTRSRVCMCPTTERDLGDGVGPAAAFVGGGIEVSLGSDGQSTIDLFEEARAVEMNERLITERRGIHDPVTLLAAATDNGARSLGWDAGAIAAGRLCDLITLDPESPRLATCPDVAGIIAAATAADVRDVVVGGVAIVRDGRHLGVPDVGAALKDSIEVLFA